MKSDDDNGKNTFDDNDDNNEDNKNNISGHISFFLSILTFLLTKATRTATLARRPRVTIVPYMKMKQYWANGLILNV